MLNISDLLYLFSKKDITIKELKNMLDSDLEYILRYYYETTKNRYFVFDKLPKRNPKLLKRAYKTPIKVLQKLIQNLLNAKTIPSINKELQNFARLYKQGDALFAKKFLEHRYENEQLEQAVHTLLHLDTNFSPILALNNIRNLDYPIAVHYIPKGFRMCAIVNTFGKAKVFIEDLKIIYLPSLERHIEKQCKRLGLKEIVFKGYLTKRDGEIKDYINNKEKIFIVNTIDRVHFNVYDLLTLQEFEGTEPTKNLVRHLRMVSIIKRMRSGVIKVLNTEVADSPKQLKTFIAVTSGYKQNFDILLSNPNKTYTKKGTYKTFINKVSYILEIKKVGAKILYCETACSGYKVTIKKGITHQLCDEIRTLPEDKKGVRVMFLKNPSPNIFKDPIAIDFGILNIYVDTVSDIQNKFIKIKERI